MSTPIQHNSKVRMALFLTQDEEKGFSHLNATEKKTLLIFFKNARRQVQLNSPDSRKNLGQTFKNTQSWIAENKLSTDCLTRNFNYIEEYLKATPDEYQTRVTRLAYRFNQTIEELGEEVDQTIEDLEKGIDKLSLKK